MYIIGFVVGCVVQTIVFTLMEKKGAHMEHWISILNPATPVIIMMWV